MLEQINPGKLIEKDEYKNNIGNLKKKLGALQQKTYQMKIPFIICFEGFSASGKGTQIGKLLYPLDPRHVSVYTMDKVNEDITMRPYIWQYFCKTPENGRIAIFDKSYHRIILDKGTKWKLKQKEIDEFYSDVNHFEKLLVDNGTVIIKFFLHISREEQKNRFDELQKKESTQWLVDDEDIFQNENYEICLKQFSHLLTMTHNQFAPWTIVEAGDRRYATMKIYNTIIEQMEMAILQKDVKEHKIFMPSKVNYLKKADLSQELENDVYKKKLYKLQKKINEIGYVLYLKRKSCVIVFEGWDASGKGGSIKRITQRLDPRAYEVISTPAPTPLELAHNYWWRFINRLPKDGHMAIFDRSWYGRVLVERVEELCSDADWQRAYEEINNMEKNIFHHGSVILKFWMHIDPDEQLARFNTRMENPLKRYKITEDDWRNRDKWPLYEKAVNDMLHYTNTSYAPWTIVAANSKRFARIKTLEIVTKTLEKAFL